MARRLKRIGSLWQRKSKSGKPFLSGYLDRGLDGDLTIAVFRVQEKQTDKSPDFTIVLVPPGEQQKPGATAPTLDDDIPLPE